MKTWMLLPFVLIVGWMMGGWLPELELRQVVTRIDPSVTAVALTNADDSLRKTVFAVLSKRLQRILKSGFETMGDKSSEEVEEARRRFEEAMRAVERPS